MTPDDDGRKALSDHLQQKTCFFHSHIVLQNDGPSMFLSILLQLQGTKKYSNSSIIHQSMTEEQQYSFLALRSLSAISFRGLIPPKASDWLSGVNLPSQELHPHGLLLSGKCRTLLQHLKNGIKCFPSAQALSAVPMHPKT